MTDSFNRRPIALGIGAAAACLLSVGSVQAQTITYGYDALGRLTAVSRSDGTSVTYAYDEAGNRTSVAAAGLVETPDPFELGAFVTGATAGAWHASAAPVLSGFVSPLAVTVTGGQYRIGSGSFTTAAGTVNPGQSVQVRVQAPAAGGASQTATLNVGGVSDTFRVTTAVDTTPAAFNLGGPSTGASGAWVNSAVVTVAGVNAATPVSVSGGQYRINSGSFTTAAGTVTAGQTVQVRVQAPATGGASQTATLIVGGVSDTFQVTAVAAPDTTPNTFNLGGPSTGTSGAWVNSSVVTVAGVNAAAPVSVSGGQYRIGSGSFTTAAGTVTAGQTVQVRVQTPAAGGASQTATLNVGGVTDTFQVTAVSDTAPNAFNLGGPSTGTSGAWVASSTVTVAGVNAAAPVSITGGQFRINGGAWRTAAATVTAGQTVQVQAQAPATAGASQTATLNIGGVTDTFQVTAASTNRAPNAVADMTSASPGSTKVFNVLANDSDPDGDPLTITAVTQPGHGVATITHSGTRITFVGNSTGYQTMTYTISDGNGETDSAMATVNVTGGGID